MQEKVLIVDDEQAFLDTLSERMRNRGMTVATSTSAKDAIARVTEENFDAILLDLQMPEVDGLQALEELKKLRPELQVILLTGHATVDKGIRAMKLGAMDLIEKPADINKISEKIQKAKARKMILVEKKTEEKIREIISTKGW